MTGITKKKSLEQIKNFKESSLSNIQVARLGEVNLSIVDDYSRGLFVQRNKRVRIERVIAKAPKLNEVAQVHSDTGDISRQLKYLIVSDIFKGLIKAGEGFSDAISEAAVDPKKVDRILTGIAKFVPKEIEVTGELSIKELVDNIDATVVEAEIVEDDDKTVADAEVLKSIEVD